MRRSSLVVASALFALAATSARSAAADTAPAYSYEVENADVSPDKVLVVWPRTCQASGKPLGAVDLALNPDWASRMNEVDYEVVVKGKRHGIVDHCMETARFYALPASEFPRGTRTSTADDSAIGQPEAGAPFTILPALDAVDLKKRIDLFGSDPRVLKASYRFEPPKIAGSYAQVKAVHDVLAVDGFGATAFSVIAKRVIYTYDDGTTEVRAYVGASRPESLRARGDAGTEDASATGVPSPDAGVATGTSPTGKDEPAPSDRGTRFVYLAAIAGLVAGGVLAFYRKKRERAGR